MRTKIVVTYKGRIITIDRNGQLVETNAPRPEVKYLRFLGMTHIPDGEVGDYVDVWHEQQIDTVCGREVVVSGLWKGKVTRKFSDK